MCHKLARGQHARVSRRRLPLHERADSIGFALPSDCPRPRAISYDAPMFTSSPARPWKSAYAKLDPP